MDTRVTALVNARGPATYLGGANVSEGVASAMASAARRSVFMSELQADASRRIAPLIGAEAVYVTGCGAAGVLIALAACEAGDDLSRILTQPANTGLSAKVVMQRSDAVSLGGVSALQVVRMIGAIPTEVGTANVCTESHLAAGLTGDVVAGLWVEHGPELRATLSAERFIAACHRVDVSVVVDAACSVRPGAYLESGADLVVFSGQKWFGGPTSGLVAGRAELVRACALIGEVGVGRPMKAGKEAVAGVTRAIEEWHVADPSARHAREHAIVAELVGGLSHVPGLECHVIDSSWESTSVGALRLDLESPLTGGWQLAVALIENDPPIEVDYRSSAPRSVFIDPWMLCEDDVDSIVSAICAFAADPAKHLVAAPAPGSQLEKVVDIFSSAFPGRPDDDQR